jgi:hypothetical protein
LRAALRAACGPRGLKREERVDVALERGERLIAPRDGPGVRPDPGREAHELREVAGLFARGVAARDPRRANALDARSEVARFRADVDDERIPRVAQGDEKGGKVLAASATWLRWQCVSVYILDSGRYRLV